MGSLSFVYAASLPQMTGSLLVYGLIALAYWDIRRRRRRTQEIFPLPFIGRWVRLSVLQQYVLRETFAPIALAVCALTFFMLVRVVYQLMDLLTSNWALGPILQTILAKLPAAFSITIPIAILMGVMLGIGRMAVENEIRACQTAGVHLVRIFAPMIVICFLISGGMILMNSQYAPGMEKQARRLKNRLVYEGLCSIPAGVEQKIKTKAGDYTFFYGNRDPKTGDMLQVRMLIEREIAPQETTSNKKASSSAPASAPVKVSLLSGFTGSAYAADPSSAPTSDTAAQKSPKKKSKKPAPVVQRDIVLAARATIQYDQVSDELSLNLYDAASQSSRSGDSKKSGAADGTSEGFIKSSTIHYPLAPEKEQRKPREYRSGELIGALIAGRHWASWKNDKEDDYQDERRAFKVELARRTAIPLACLAFVLLGIPLAIFARPSGKSIGITIALVLVLVYYWMVQWGSGMAEKGNDLGLFIIFLPNLLMTGLGLILLRRAVRL